MYAGIEVEIPGLSRSDCDSILQFFPGRLADDGSIRQRNWQIDGVPILPNGRRRTRLRTDGLIPSYLHAADVFGAEFVSEKLQFEVLRDYVKKLSRFLSCMPNSPRAGIHIHLDVNGMPWRFFQRLFHLTYKMELPLMRIFGAGTLHRGGLSDNSGELVDYRFCRPLAHPIYVVSDGPNPVRVPVIDLDLLLNADTASSFVSAWGRFDMYWTRDSLSHYIPHRLHVWNLAATVRLGSIEMRAWNANYRHMIKMLDITKKLYDMAADDVSVDIDLPFDTDREGLDSEAIRLQMENILAIELKDLWGSNWPLQVVDMNKMHHYQGFYLPSYEFHPLNRIRVGGKLDDGTDFFPLASRG